MLHKLLHKNKKSGIFYYRKRVPKVLQSIIPKQEIVKSLRTKNELIALGRAVVMEEDVEKTKKSLEDYDSYMANREYIEITENNYQEIIDLFWDEASEADLKSYGTFSDTKVLSLVKNKNKREIDSLSDIKQTKFGDQEGLSKREIASEMVQHLQWRGYRVNDIKSPYFNALLDAYIEAEIFERQLINKQFEEAKNNLNIPEKIREKLNKQKKQQSDTTPLFSEVHAEFIAYKIKNNNLSTKMQKGYGRNYRDWIDYFSDQKIGFFGKKEIKGFILAYMDMPVRTKKLYKGVSFSELKKWDIPDEDVVTQKTVKEVLKWVQGVFSYAVNEMEVLVSSRAGDLNLDLGKINSYAPYSDTEIRLLISESSNLDRPKWAKYLIPLAVYTGARLGELVQLAKKDIKRDEDSGRHYIHINDLEEWQSVKNGNATRQVPIHDKLIELGFLEYVQSCDVRVFDELASLQVTRWFGAFRKKSGIQRVDDYGGRKVFHSFRHTFTTKAQNSSKQLAKIQQVLGHEKSIGETKTYTHFKVANLLEVVDSITF